MKNLLTFLLFTLSVSVFGQNAVLVEVSGKVEINQGSGWRTATIGMNVPLMATISTGFNSSAIFRVGESTLTISALSRLTLEEHSLASGEETTRLNLSSGRVRASVRSTTNDQVNFQITSPIATASVRGTVFDFDGLRVNVFEGLVDFGSTPDQIMSVPAGGQSLTGKDGEGPSTVAEFIEQETTVVVTTKPNVVARPVRPPTGTPQNSPVPIPIQDTIFGDTASLILRIE